MNSIPQSVRAVLDLFATELAELRFGDLDAALLTRLAEEVGAAEGAVAQAEAALAAARTRLHEGHDALLLQAQRALAYAKVYAEENPDLAQSLELISLPRVGVSVRGARKAREGSPVSDVVGAEEPTPSSPRGKPRKAARVSSEDAGGVSAGHAPTGAQAFFAEALP
jgi:ElaB/YqjD/DUF883 family membrane-anchored ribosome-binding protein